MMNVQATCEEAEKWEAVMDLFEELKQSGIEPSRQSYEYVTRACKEHMVRHTAVPVLQL